MTAPRYRLRDKPDVEVEAIQFIQDDPTTHWHVNFSHPHSKEFENTFWVLTDKGAMPIADGDYVVQYPVPEKQPNRTGRAIASPEEFAAGYEVAPDKPPEPPKEAVDAVDRAVTSLSQRPRLKGK